VPDVPKLGLIGRDYVLIKKLARKIWHDLPNGTMVTRLRETLDRRGFCFEIQVQDGAGVPTGHVARVQVTLDRFDGEPSRGVPVSLLPGCEAYRLAARKWAGFAREEGKADGKTPQ
jgi:hypothetical protein